MCMPGTRLVVGRQKANKRTCFLPSLGSLFSAGDTSEGPSSNPGSDLYDLRALSTLYFLSEPQITLLYVGIILEATRNVE